MSRNPRVVVEQFPNELIREFHVNERIASEKLYDTLPGADALARFSVRDHSPVTVQTALSFYDIEGVTSVSLDIYEVRITISRAFDWEDVQPQVLDLIRKHLQWDDCEIRQHDSRPTYNHGSSLGGFGALGLDLDVDEPGEPED